MTFDNIEMKICKWYMAHATDEILISKWASGLEKCPSVIVVEGFEKRSLGLLRKLDCLNLHPPKIVLGRYNNEHDYNEIYRQEFEDAINKVANRNVHMVEIDDDSEWVREAVNFIGSSEILFDISGLTAGGMFGAMDTLMSCDVKVTIAYSEALEYSPTKEKWQQLKNKASDHSSKTISEYVDEEQWQYGGNHTVEIMAGHEGFDSVGINSIVAFLPFKCARLGAILSDQGYSERLFIAGKPRLEKYNWRLEALREFNASITKDWPVIDVSTFGYLTTVNELYNSICAHGGLLGKYDVHLSVTGSKLQKYACWVFSSLVPEITVMHAITDEYYPDAFSNGIGETWVIPVLEPRVAIRAIIESN